MSDDMDLAGQQRLIAYRLKPPRFARARRRAQPGDDRGLLDDQRHDAVAAVDDEVGRDGERQDRKVR